MQGLPDNPASDETTVKACNYSMFSASQCPKALSWMAALALAAGKTEDAEQWVVELIGSILFRDLISGGERALAETRGTAGTS